MKILVTVGTTAFDSMVKRIDFYYKGRENSDEIIYQIAGGDYKPETGVFFDYTDDIYSYYSNADLIITHAGAGTIYKLLEMNKKVIAIPNMERVDKHQNDISKYMEDNNFLLVCWNLEEIENTLSTSDEFIPIVYKKDDFFKFEDIANFIKSRY